MILSDHQKIQDQLMAQTAASLARQYYAEGDLEESTKCQYDAAWWHAVSGIDGDIDVEVRIKGTQVSILLESDLDKGWHDVSTSTVLPSFASALKVSDVTRDGYYILIHDELIFTLSLTETIDKLSCYPEGPNSIKLAKADLAAWLFDDPSVNSVGVGDGVIDVYGTDSTIVPAIYKGHTVVFHQSEPATLQ